MNEALNVVKKYYGNWNVFDGLSDKVIRNTLLKEWNKYENEWFIKYLNDKLKSNSLDLMEMMEFLKKLNIEFNLLTLKDVLSKCKEFDAFLSHYFKNDKIYTLEELEKYEESELLIIYATLNNKLEEEKIDETEYYNTDIVADSERMYFNEVHNIPLLPWEKVREYFEKIEEYKKLLKEAKDQDLINKYNTKIEYLQKRIVEGNLRLVIRPATRYLNRGVDFLDLIQDGNMGLMRAVESFDLNVGTKFSTYSMWWIRQALQRSVYDKGKTIRVPVHKGEEFVKVIKTKNGLEQRLGREASVEEIANSLNKDAKWVTEIMTQFEDVKSLDQVRGEEDDDRSAYDSIPSDENVERNIIDKLAVESFLSKLSPDEEEIIRLRYGVMKDEKDTIHANKHTLAEIGRICGVTRERIRQKEVKALEKLIIIANAKKDNTPIVQKPKLFFENFPHTDKEEVMKYFSSLKRTEQLVLQKKYGIDLDTFNRTSQKIAVSASSLIFKLQDMIRTKTLTKKSTDERAIAPTKKVNNSSDISKYEGKTILEITGYSREELDKAISRMDNKSLSYQLLIDIFGSDLNGRYDSSQMNSHEKNILNTFIYRLINVPTLGSPRLYYQGKTLQEITGFTTEELLEFLNSRDYSEDVFASIYKVFGYKLEKAYDSNNITNEKDKKRIYKFIKRCREGVKDEVVLTRFVGSYDGKTLAELSGLSQETLLKRLQNMRPDTKSREVLTKAFGLNLEEKFDCLKMSNEEKRIIHSVISRFNVAEKQKYNNSTEDNIDADLRYVTPFKDPLFRSFLKYIPSDVRLVTELSLGIEDGFIHSAAEVAKIVNEPEDKVIRKRDLGVRVFIETLYRYQEICKQYIPNFSENMENVLQLIKG